MDYIWDDVFTTENYDGITREMALAIACNAWGNCYAGGHPPESFGRVMQKLGEIVGDVLTPEKSLELARQITPK